MSHIAPSLRPSENATFTLSSSRLPSIERGRSTIRRYAPCIWYSLTHVLQQSRASPNSCRYCYASPHIITPTS